MNIALSALILTIILLPGAVAISAYYKSLREKQSSSLHLPFSELLLKGVLISLMFHCSSLCILSIIGYAPDINLIYTLLIGKDHALSKDEFSNSVLQFGFYTVILSAFAFSLTKLFKKLAVSKNWDIRFSFLNAYNYWYLVFSGRQLDNRLNGRREKTDFIFVDVLAKKDILYSGFLFDYAYSPQKDILQRIVLKTAAKRFYIRNDDPSQGLKLSEPSYIPGDAFIIPGEDIVNMNIYFMNVELSPEINISEDDIRILNPNTVNQQN